MYNHKSYSCKFTYKFGINSFLKKGISVFRQNSAVYRSKVPYLGGVTRIGYGDDKIIIWEARM